MSVASTTLNAFGIFGDEVYTSTDLNRRSGEVLNHALLRPVTISRNHEQFALFRREIAANIFGTLNQLQSAMTVLFGIQQALAGEQVPPVVSWVNIYDKDDLQKLASEVLTAAVKSMGNGDSNQLGALIHEWRESALVAESGVLDAMMHTETSDETPIPHPDDVLQSAAGELTACSKE